MIGAQYLRFALAAAMREPGEGQLSWSPYARGGSAKPRDQTTEAGAAPNSARASSRGLVRSL